jgi:hypothetical protein
LPSDSQNSEVPGRADVYDLKVCATVWLLLQSRSYIEAVIKEDEAAGEFIDPSAAEYAGYKPKPYVVNESNLESSDRFRELTAGPQISETEAARIRAIREEYRK